MKKINTIVTAIILTISSLSFGQQVNDIKKINDKIVDRLNTPTKMWTNGQWEVSTDGTRYWQKGCWKFNEKTFQQKSEIFRNKARARNKA
jgi:hypothetical protein